MKGLQGALEELERTDPEVAKAAANYERVRDDIIKKGRTIMGQWNISIHGTGVHHNADLEQDANRMAADFVKQMRAKGHVVTKATITYGGEEDVTDADGYLARFKKKDAEP